jgi:hypothetical protein
MVRAGATRLGLSGTAGVLAGLLPDDAAPLTPSGDLAGGDSGGY